MICIHLFRFVILVQYWKMIQLRTPPEQGEGPTSLFTMSYGMLTCNITYYLPYLMRLYFSIFRVDYMNMILDWSGMVFIFFTGTQIYPALLC